MDQLKKDLIIACLLTAIVGCRAAERVADSALTVAKGLTPSAEERELRTALKQTHDLGSRASKVVFYEVANEFDDDFKALASKPRIVGYPVRTKRVLSRESVSRLIDILSDRSSYFPPNDGWTCIFEPHHVLQLQGGGDTETIVICIHCGDVDFHWNRLTTGKSLTSASNVAITAEIRRLLHQRPA